MSVTRPPPRFAKPPSCFICRGGPADVRVRGTATGPYHICDACAAMNCPLCGRPTPLLQRTPFLDSRVRPLTCRIPCAPPPP